MEFKVFKDAVQKQFESMKKGKLFRTGTSKDTLWDTYLGAFPEGTDPIFRERTEHDCQCCKQFIRAMGNVVAIRNNKLVSIWDVEVGGEYQVVTDALSAYVKSRRVVSSFLLNSKVQLTNSNFDNHDDSIKWNHFFAKVPMAFRRDGEAIGTELARSNSVQDVAFRSLALISIEAADTVLELIEQNSLYRGEEFKRNIKDFVKYKREFDKVPADEKDNYVWTKAHGNPVLAIKNTAIGSLLVDVSDEVPLDEAVRLFESKVAPTNYKRSSAVITKSMIKQAQGKVAELGIEDSLQRRYAVLDDITINNVLYADRTVKQALNVFDELADAVPDKPKNLDKVEEVNIDTFIETILPKANGIELLLENNQANNLMSLIAPMNKEAKPIFKWGNNFSWSYNGEVADSMKERVKKAGGDVTGVLRFSIQWNDGDNNQNDFDAHCIEPKGNLISYPKAGRRQPSSGILDVDIVNPGNSVAVENITWNNKAKMQEGKYQFLVHNFSHNGGKTGFTAEIEYDGQIYRFEYDKGLRDGEKVQVATIMFTRKSGIAFTKSLNSTTTSKEVWGIGTNKFHKVKAIMHSPNHWDGNKTGNKHWFFMLDNCNNPDKARGFYNEFLDEDLREHRKVFEVLASKMKTEETKDQLSGLGFSSTKRATVVCKVSGSFNRIIKIKF